MSAGSATIFGIVTIVYTDPDNTFLCAEGIQVTCDQVRLSQLIGAGSACTAFVMVFISFIPDGRVLSFVHVVVGTALLAL